VQAKKRAGVDVISLGIGDPGSADAQAHRQRLAGGRGRSGNHRYPSYFGLAELREAITNWYRERFNVALDPGTEILPTLGSRMGSVTCPSRWSIPATWCSPPILATRSNVTGGR